MPLITIGPELARAQAEGYALPLFDTANVESTEGMIEALEEHRAPAMVALYSGLLDRPNGVALAAYVRQRATESTVPISLMLDHGLSFEHCIKALRAGFSDVMFDGSRLPLEENIAETKAVVRAAHAVGACVEAELGHVGSGRDYQTFGALRLGFTDPDTVERFVAETGVDMLAVAVGTAHGLYQGDPQLDLELLAAIHARVDIPLALHGGSGVTIIATRRNPSYPRVVWCCWPSRQGGISWSASTASVGEQCSQSTRSQSPSRRCRSGAR